jgi:hypothetical protein
MRCPPTALSFSIATTLTPRSLAAIFTAARSTSAPAPAPIRDCLQQPKTLPGCTSAFAPGSARAQFTLHLLGAHNALNALAGLAVALEAGVDLDAAVAALETLTAGDKRGEVIEVKGATILNDCYNSNPEALRSMIRTLAARPAKRRILIAGEMLEMGEHGPALHAACGRAAAEAGLDLVVGVGGNAEHLGRRRLRGRSRRAVFARRRSRRPLAQAESPQGRRGAGQRLARRASGAGDRGAEACKRQLSRRATLIVNCLPVSSW